MRLVLLSKACAKALLGVNGICKCLANPLPEPMGIMPNGILLPTSALAT